MRFQMIFVFPPELNSGKIVGEMDKRVSLSCQQQQRTQPVASDMLAFVVPRFVHAGCGLRGQEVAVCVPQICSFVPFD